MPVRIISFPCDGITGGSFAIASGDPHDTAVTRPSSGLKRDAPIRVIAAPATSPRKVVLPRNRVRAELAGQESHYFTVMVPFMPPAAWPGTVHM